MISAPPRLSPTGLASKTAHVRTHLLPSVPPAARARARKPALALEFFSPVSTTCFPQPPEHPELSFLLPAPRSPDPSTEEIVFLFPPLCPSPGSTSLIQTGSLRRSLHLPSACTEPPPTPIGPPSRFEDSPLPGGGHSGVAMPERAAPSCPQCACSLPAGLPTQQGCG